MNVMDISWSKTDLLRSFAAWKASAPTSAVSLQAHLDLRNPLGTEPWWSLWSKQNKGQDKKSRMPFQPELAILKQYETEQILSKHVFFFSFSSLLLAKSLKMPPSSWNLAATKSNSSIWCSPKMARTKNNKHNIYQIKHKCEATLDNIYVLLV